MSKVEVAPYWKLSVTVLRAELNHSCDYLSAPDCYVILKLPTSSAHSHRTKTVSNSSTPEWNETFHFRIQSQIKNVLELQVYDEDPFNPDELCAIILFDISSLTLAEKQTRMFVLNDTTNDKLWVEYEMVAWLAMAEYTVAVTTGSMIHAGTIGRAYITLIGTEGESEKTRLDNLGNFITGTIGTFTVSTPSSLGSLLLVKLEKHQYQLLVEDEWFCSKVQVSTPEGELVHFPCYTWLSSGEEIQLRHGRVQHVFHEEDAILINHRERQLATHKLNYQWRVMEGLPDVIDADEPSDLPEEIRFSLTKNAEILSTKMQILVILGLKGLTDDTNQWNSFEDIKQAFSHHKTPISEYIEEHWKEDEFFGYQVLNGYNPMAIQRCMELPSKFAVTDTMVAPFLECGNSLAAEMQKGNIFLLDYRRISGLPTTVIHGRQQYIAAPLCLLYKNPQDKLLPIAIQLNQEPGPDNPVFLPSDSEHDWLLAKMYLRNADFHEHEANSHYLRTHGLSEVFAISTLRNLPTPHPLYKLLIPHTRYTLHMNTTGRVKLFGPEGIYTTATNLGGQGTIDLFKRWFSEVTYSSLCLPEDIAVRGLESIPNFYYRDDGLKLWAILNRYVHSMMEHYYPSDQEVQRDSELQIWIKDIFIHGFQGQTRTGIPDRFCTVEEVIKFVTMVIFNMSAQHSAVNMGQFDYGGWLPNSPNSMQKPPPTSKGRSTEQTLLDTLPDISTSVNGAVFRWMLSTNSLDFIPLGCFPDEHFCEDAPLRIIDTLKADLAQLSRQIEERNRSNALPVPYLYLCPTKMENSVSI